MQLDDCLKTKLASIAKEVSEKPIPKELEEFKTKTKKVSKKGGKRATSRSKRRMQKNGDPNLHFIKKYIDLMLWNDKQFSELCVDSNAELEPEGDFLFLSFLFCFLFFFLIWIAESSTKNLNMPSSSSFFSTADQMIVIAKAGKNRKQLLDKISWSNKLGRSHYEFRGSTYLIMTLFQHRTESRDKEWVKYTFTSKSTKFFCVYYRFVNFFFFLIEVEIELLLLLWLFALSWEKEVIEEICCCCCCWVLELVVELGEEVTVIDPARAGWSGDVDVCFEGGSWSEAGIIWFDFLPEGPSGGDTPMGVDPGILEGFMVGWRKKKVDFTKKKRKKKLIIEVVVGLIWCRKIEILNLEKRINRRGQVVLVLICSLIKRELNFFVCAWLQLECFIW